MLVQTPEDVDRLEVADPEKVAYLTQTTLSVDDAAGRSQRLRERFPKIVGPLKGDICYATQNRQEAVRTLVAAGGRGAGRGQPEQLQQPAAGRDGPARRRRPSHLIDGPADIDLAWFSGDETVLITAGASAPENVVQECVAWLRRAFGAAVEPCTRLPRRRSVSCCPLAAPQERNSPT